MKKLLGLLAVAPMALAACGGSEEATKDTATYFLGHGANSGDWKTEGTQNESYGLIAINVSEDSDGALTYEVNESANYYEIAAADIKASAHAAPEFTSMSTDGADGDYEGQKLIDAGYTSTDVAGGGEIVATDWYDNTGETLRFVFDVVEIDFDRATEKLADDKLYTAKEDASYGNAWFVWNANKAYWESFLNNNYGTCDDVNAVTPAIIAALAADKSAGAEGTLTPDPDAPTGATASESGLYYAAAATTAQAHCKA